MLQKGSSTVRALCSSTASQIRCFSSKNNFGGPPVGGPGSVGHNLHRPLGSQSTSSARHLSAAGGANPVGGPVSRADNNSAATNDKPKHVPRVRHQITADDYKRSQEMARKRKEAKPKKFDITKHLPVNAVVKNNNVHVSSGRGCWVYDKWGHEYLDMTSGIGVLSTGHCHPHVVKAVKDQIDNIVHAQQAMFQTHDAQNEFVEKLLKVMPGQGLPDGVKHDMVYFTNSGSEATENAIKVAKMVTKRPNVLALSGGFHGRTLASMAWCSSKTSYKSGFVNTAGGNFFLTTWTPEAFDQVLATQTSPEETAAVIVEPVQGEGGVNQIPKPLMEHIRKRCTEHGIMLVFDEVQSGVGRCGAMWAHELVGVVPDILCFAKGIASGMPMGGITAPHRLFEPLTKNSLASTFGGNPVCLASASATLDVIEKENLIDNANKMGAKIAENLAAMPYLEGIRQHGLLIAADVDPAVATVGQVITRAVQDEKMILHTCGTNSLRIIPALTLSEREVEIFSEKLHNVLKDIGKPSDADKDTVKVM